MTTSSLFEISLQGDQRLLFAHKMDALAIPCRMGDLLPLSADEPFMVAVRRPAGDTSRLRVCLGNEPLFEVPPGSVAGESALQPWLRNELGESKVVLDREVEDDRFETIFELGLAVAPRPEVARDYRVMIEDIAGIHQGLVQDVMGRGTLQASWGGDSVSQVQPETVLPKLESIYQRLERVLVQIARQPSVGLERTVQRARYRAGDRADGRLIATALRDPETRLKDGRVAALGKVSVRRVRVSEDLPEHRHMAEGIRRLSARSESLAHHCLNAAKLLQREEERWGGRPESVFAQRDLPRIQILGEIALDAHRLGIEFRGLLQQYRFLASAGPPRTQFGPTPAFLGRAAYREVYRLLMEARQLLGALVDGDAVRFIYRNLPDLYEYWCFVRVVGYLRQRFGPSRSRQTFALIDDIYRPQLAPGQQFRFETSAGVRITATYQPEFHPWRLAQQRGDRFAASMTRHPLRPDITLEAAAGSEPPVLLALDAKSTDAFSPLKFRELTDYARLVFDVRTGRQPIQQVFLLHRDRQTRVLTNLPGYLDGQPCPREVMLFGAVACIPERVHHTPATLALVIDRFLERHATR